MKSGAAVRLVRDSGIAVVVVDKTVSAILSLADRVTVLVKATWCIAEHHRRCARRYQRLVHRHLGV